MVIPIGTDLTLERTPWATISIIVITTISQYLNFGTGEWLIPIPIFQHFGFFHIFFNMLFLWIFGSYLEARIGWLKFVLFYVLSEFGSLFVSFGLMGQAYIGASGAISGIMALYLARFFHSKIRTVFWFGPFPIRYDLPVMFLLPLWFAKDLASGVLGMAEVTGTGYFAHVGGFLSGLIIAKVMKFDVEGRSEHFKLQAARRIAESEEMPRVLKDLKRALEENFEDPEIHHLLGQYYARSSDGLRLARKYFLQAIEKYSRDDRDALKSAGVFVEMVKKCGAESSLEGYLKYATVLDKASDHERASALLSPILGRDDLSGETGKRALARLINNARASGRPELGAMAEGRFRALFPGIEIPEPDESSFRKTLVLPISREQVGKSRWSLWKWLDEVMNTWVFWFWWAIIFLPVAIFIEVSHYETLGDGSIVLAIIVPTAVAGLATHIYLNAGNTIGGFLYGTGYRKSELEAQRNFNISTYLRKGMASEGEKHFEDAVAYYKGVLAEDPKHIEARFRLARIYHHNLERKGSAIHEYEKLIELVPENASYYLAAKEAIEELRGERPAPEPIKPLEWKE